MLNRVKKIFASASLVMLAMFAMCPLQTVAQDILVTKDGASIKVWGVDVGKSAVFYRESRDENAPTKRIAKSELMMVKFQNGERLIIEDEESAQQPVSTVQANAPAALSPEEEAEIEKRNATIVDEYNRRTVQFKETPKDKKARMLLCTFGLRKSRLVDNNVELVINGVNATTMHPTIKVGVKNNTDKPVYVDLGNTFFMRNDEVTPYYIPTATTTTTSNTKGATINMGAVAGALGIGGAAGTLASGVNVGRATTSETSTTTFSQRVLVVPPHSTTNLEAQPLFPVLEKTYYRFKTKKYLNTDVVYAFYDLDLKLGEKKYFGDAIDPQIPQSPLNYGVYLSYSFDEECTNLTSLYFSLYMREIMGVNRNSKNLAVLDYGDLDGALRLYGFVSSN